jgi:hypothetical protein
VGAYIFATTKSATKHLWTCFLIENMPSEHVYASSRGRFEEVSFNLMLGMNTDDPRGGSIVYTTGWDGSTNTPWSHSEHLVVAAYENDHCTTTFYFLGNVV